MTQSHRISSIKVFPLVCVLGAMRLPQFAQMCVVFLAMWHTLAHDIIFTIQKATELD
jgi:hypothetical protein